jgi:hypothetical protein
VGPEILSNTTLMRARAASWTEADLQDAVILDCREYGLTVKYDADPKRSTVKGWPDLMIVGRHGILYRELKNMTYGLTAEQRRIGSILALAGANWSTWRPIDWWNGTIARQLESIL